MIYIEKFFRLILIILLLFPGIKSLQAQTFAEVDSLSLPGLRYSHADLGDFNNDGTLDIIMVGFNSSDTNKAYIYSNNGDWSFTLAQDLSQVGTKYSEAKWYDFNKDGYLDIILGVGKLDTIRLFISDKGNSFNFVSEFSIHSTDAFLTSWGDYDNDGLLDCYTSSLYKNPGTIFFRNAPFIDISIPGHAYLYNLSSAWGDYTNDGLLDIVVTGVQSDWMARVSMLFKNTPTHRFVKDTVSQLNGVQSAALAWGDCDNDGDLDLIMSGNSLPHANQAWVFINNNGVLTKLITLTGLHWGSVAWGDYDNDGFLDILMMGERTYTTTNDITDSYIYRNNGDNTFTLLDEEFEKLARGKGLWGDLDNDGDLDFILTGKNSKQVELTKIYRNNIFYMEPKIINNAPNTPTNLAAVVSDDSITFTWDKSSDMETPADGLSYNLYVYNVSTGKYAKSPMAFTTADDNNGLRQVSEMGSIRYSENGYRLKRIPAGDYKWSVQSIDAGYKGSAFAEEKTFTSTYVVGIKTELNNSTVSFFPNPAGNSLTIQGLEGGLQADFYSTEGKLLKSVLIRERSRKIDISDLPKGIILLSLKGNNYFRTEKLIKL